MNILRQPRCFLGKVLSGFCASALSPCSASPIGFGERCDNLF